MHLFFEKCSHRCHCGVQSFDDLVFNGHHKKKNHKCHTYLISSATAAATDACAVSNLGFYWFWSLARFLLTWFSSLDSLVFCRSAGAFCFFSLFEFGSQIKQKRRDMSALLTTFTYMYRATVEDLVNAYMSLQRCMWVYMLICSRFYNDYIVRENHLKILGKQSKWVLPKPTSRDTMLT